MAVRDWLTSPVDWGEWGTRANYWFNELVDDVRGNTAAAVAAQVDADAALLDLSRYTSAYETNRVSTLNNGAASTAFVTDLAIAVDMVNGGVYKICFDGHAYSSIAGDLYRFRLVGPSASPIYANFDNRAQANNTAQPCQGSFLYTAVATSTLTFNLQHNRISGTGTVYSYADTGTLRYFDLWSERVA